MKIRLKTYQLALLVLLSIVIPVSVIALAQGKQSNFTGASKDAEHACKGNHSRKDFYQSIRILEPSTVLEVVGNRLNYATNDQGIELGSFDLEENYSIVPKDFATNHSGCFQITYCSKHLVVLSIDQVESKNCVQLK